MTDIKQGNGGIRLICIGRQRTGKTTFSRDLLSKKPYKFPAVIYDINGEYKDFYPHEFEDFDVFLEKIVKLRHSYILIEEATIFFDARDNFDVMKNLLVRARHTGNIIQLNFHSWASVPKPIFNLLNYVVVFKTNDTEKDVKNKYDNPALLKAFRESRESKDPFFKTIVNLQ